MTDAEQADKEDVQVVVCNVRDGRGVFRNGAKAWVLNMPGSPERVRISALTISGRRATKWHHTRFLSNPRVKNLPDKLLSGVPFAGYHGRSPEITCEAIRREMEKAK